MSIASVINESEEVESQADEINLGVPEEYGKINKNKQCLSSESNAGNQSSMSSSFSASKTDSNSEIKYIEEGLDYERTPRPIMFLKLCLGFLMLISVALSSIQYGINS